MWQNISLFPSRRTTSVSGDPNIALVALAGENSSGSLAVLIANPQNRSVSFTLSRSDGQALCSAQGTRCTTSLIEDTGGEVLHGSSAGGNITICAWGTMTVTAALKTVIMKSDDAGAALLRLREAVMSADSDYSLIDSGSGAAAAGWRPEVGKFVVGGELAIICTLAFKKRKMLRPDTTGFDATGAQVWAAGVLLQMFLGSEKGLRLVAGRRCIEVTTQAIPTTARMPG